MSVTNCADTRRCRHIARRNSCAEAVSYFCGSNMLIPTAPLPHPCGGRLPFAYPFIIKACCRGPHCYTTLLLCVGKASVLYLTMVYQLHRFQCFFSKGCEEGGVVRWTCRMTQRARRDTCFANFGVVSALSCKSCRLHCDSICGQILSKHVYSMINPLNAELNPICYLLALLEGANIVDVSGLRVNSTKSPA